MADMKISQLPAASAAADAQEFEINDSGTSRKITYKKMREGLKGVFDEDYAAKTAQFQGAKLGGGITPASWNDLPSTYPYTGLVPNVIKRTPDNGGPPGFNNHYYYVQQFIYTSPAATPNCVQLALPYTTALPAWRVRTNGVWSAWRTIGYSTTLGRTLMTAADAAAARTAIGAGTSNLELGNTDTTAKPGDWVPDIDTQTTGQLPYSRISGAPSGVSLPARFGVGSYVIATSASQISGGSEVPGASIRAIVLAGGGYHYDGTAVSGTWRNMGSYLTNAPPGNYTHYYNLYMRIA